MPQVSCQELPEASPPQPPQAASTTSPTTIETLSPEELELIRHHRATTRESSPAKKPRTDEEFLTALSAKDVGLSDLDFGLQEELRSSPQARADFLALNLTSPEALHFDPDKANSRRLTSPRSDLSLFTDLQQVETPTLEHPRAIQHSHSDRHHGYQIEDIGIHDWQQSTPTSRTTSYRIYNEQPRLGHPSTWRTRTQSSTWTSHNYSAALPSLPDWCRSHHRCTSMQQSQRPCPLCDYHLHFSKNEWNSYQKILGSSFGLTNILQFDYIVVDELTNFVNNSYLFQDIFLGMDPYTNNELTHLLAICSCSSAWA